MKKTLETAKALQLAEGEVRILGRELPDLGHYGGEAVICVNGVKYLLSVSDRGSECVEPGEIDEDTLEVKKEPRILDWLATTIHDVSTGKQVTYDDVVDSRNIHGLFYAAECLADPETERPDHYAGYIRDEIRDRLGWIL